MDSAAVRMAGIDYKRAAMAVREAFAFGRDELARALEGVRAGNVGLGGCIVVATCNRTEIWVSGECDVPLSGLLCSFKGLAADEFEDFFVYRQGREAISHLFRTAAGLESQIFGENQILAQIKDALLTARTAGSAGTLLDRLFLSAISRAKRIKSETNITRADRSVAAFALVRIRERFAKTAGLRCLVIGNGVIARLCAETLARQGCRVALTLRLHREADTIIPHGCEAVPYDKRYELLNNYDIVISATASPHYTLTYDEVAAEWDGVARLFLDLALPRDMENRLRELSGLTLLDLDEVAAVAAATATAGEGGEGKSFGGEAEKIDGMIEAGVNEFIFWADFRKYHQKIIAIGERSAGEISACIAHSAEREAVFTRANKAVLRLLFSLKDTISVDQWERCFDALEAASVKGAPDSALEVAPPLEIPQSETAPSFGAPSFSAPKLSWFPFFQNISGKRALVAGGGKIAARRVKSLLKFDCTIEVISPVMCAQIETLAASNGGKLTLTRRVWQEGDCRRADFVTLATDEREVNERAARECKNANIPVSVADAQEESSFFFPALAVRGNVVVGISSGGTNHKEARDAAEKIRTVLSDK